MPSYAAAHLTGIRTPDGRETEGWFVAAPLLPEQMLALPREEVYARILRAIDIGVELGARDRRAGRLHRGGRRRRRHDRRARADPGDDRQLADDRRRRAQSVPRRRGDGHRGRGGDGGRRRRDRLDRCGLRELIAPRVRDSDLRRAQRDPAAQAFVASSRRACPCELATRSISPPRCASADLVLTATSSTQDVIEPDDLRAGAVVCELSLPHDVSRRVARRTARRAGLEGGNMRVPGEFRAERVREPGRPIRPRALAGHGARLHVGDDGAGAREIAANRTRWAAASTSTRFARSTRWPNAPASSSPTCARSTKRSPPEAIAATRAAARTRAGPRRRENASSRVSSARRRAIIARQSSCWAKRSTSRAREWTARSIARSQTVARTRRHRRRDRPRRDRRLSVCRNAAVRAARRAAPARSGQKNAGRRRQRPQEHPRT